MNLFNLNNSEFYYYLSFPKSLGLCLKTHLSHIYDEQNRVQNRQFVHFFGGYFRHPQKLV